MGTKVEKVFSISAPWDTVGSLAPKVHKMCTRGAQDVHKMCTRGAREGHENHEMGTRGALMSTKVETVFFILTQLGQRRTSGAREVH